MSASACEYFGPLCKKLNLSTLVISSNLPLENINLNIVSNGLVEEIFSFFQKKKFTHKLFFDLLRKLYFISRHPELWLEELNESSVWLAASNVKKEKQNLTKRKADSEKKKIFLDNQFTLPVPKPSGGSSKIISKPKKRSRDSTGRSDDSEQIELLNIVTLSEENENLKEALRLSSGKNESEMIVMQQRISTLQEKLKKSKTNRVLNQKLRRKSIRVKELLNMIKFNNKSSEKNENTIAVQKKRIKVLQDQKRNRLHYLKMKIKKKSNPSSIGHERHQNHGKCISCIELNKALAEVQSEKLDLEMQLEATKTEFIATKKTSDGRSYTTDIQLAVHELATRNVSVKQISPIIRYVVEKVAKRKVGDLPEPSTCVRFIHEMNALTKIQVATKLSDSSNLTLLFDGSTKRKEHYGEAQISDANHEILNIGIAEMPGGTANDYDNFLTSIFTDINDAGKAIGLKCNLLRNISNTMADRANVNKSTVDLLKKKKQKNKTLV